MGDGQELKPKSRKPQQPSVSAKTFCIGNELGPGILSRIEMHLALTGESTERTMAEWQALLDEIMSRS